MRRARLIWVGKANRRDPESQLCDRYLTRLKPYLKLDELAIKPIVGPNTAQTQARESDKIAASLESGDILILADERGKLLSSPGFAEYMGNRFDSGARRLVFVIGGAMGMSDSLRQRADFMLSLSKMTLPHAMARALLLEQIYRACCIQAGHPYHHEG